MRALHFQPERCAHTMFNEKAPRKGHLWKKLIDTLLHGSNCFEMGERWGRSALGWDPKVFCKPVPTYLLGFLNVWKVHYWKMRFAIKYTKRSMRAIWGSFQLEKSATNKFQQSTSHSLSLGESAKHGHILIVFRFLFSQGNKRYSTPPNSIETKTFIFWK